MKNGIVFIISVAGILIAASIRETPSEWIDERDGSSYEIVEIGDLIWMRENLRYPTSESISGSAAETNCGEFYEVHEALSICPVGWRLPTLKEVGALVKQQKKKKLNIIDTLQISLCGRIDNGELGKIGLQNTFWLDAALEDGHIQHWHMFGEEYEIHSHNVVNARRQFPVRCVCEKEVLQH